MKYSILLSILFFFGMAGIISAQEAESFDQAKALSAENGKPVLLEFVRSD